MGRDKLRAYEANQAKRRESTAAEAAALIAAGRLEDAEQVVRAFDASIQGEVTLAKLYRERLEQLVAIGEVERNRVAAEAVFHRALHWARSAYPEPHTQMEADQYAAGRAEDLARLVKVLGYEPKAPSEPGRVAP